MHHMGAFPYWALASSTNVDEKRSLQAEVSQRNWKVTKMQFWDCTPRKLVHTQATLHAENKKVDINNAQYSRIQHFTHASD